MKTASFAQAKAHFSRVVDDAEHHRKSTTILRRGKPVAVVVPVEAAAKARPAMTPEEAAAFVESFPAGDPSFDCTADLLAGRR
jgi:prevent-host-death family protein